VIEPDIPPCNRVIPEEEQTVSTGPGDGVVHVAPGVRLGVLYPSSQRAQSRSRRVSVRLFVLASGPVPEESGFRPVPLASVRPTHEVECVLADGSSWGQCIEEER